MPRPSHLPLREDVADFTHASPPHLAPRSPRCAPNPARSERMCHNCDLPFTALSGTIPRATPHFHTHPDHRLEIIKSALRLHCKSPRGEAAQARCMPRVVRRCGTSMGTTFHFGAAQRSGDSGPISYRRCAPKARSHGEHGGQHGG